MVLFVYQYNYPVCSFGKFINFGLGTVRGEKVEGLTRIYWYFVLVVPTANQKPEWIKPTKLLVMQAKFIPLLSRCTFHVVLRQSQTHIFQVQLAESNKQKRDN